jgi:hypothetical protein
MGDGREPSAAPGRSSAVDTETAGAATAGQSIQAVGKQTLTEQLESSNGGTSPPAAATPGAPPPAPVAKNTPLIPGTVIEGGPLSDADVDAINTAAKSVPPQFKRYVAYAGVIKVGGSLAWRANNPGNLRDDASKIGTVHGAVGTFAVFATMEAGRAAQKSLYLNKYGAMTVKDAIEKLTPRSENDTDAYLKRLAGAGVALDKTVKSQIDTLMSAVEANEGMIKGVEVTRAAPAP